MPWPLLSALAGVSVLLGQRADGHGAVFALAALALIALAALGVRSGTARAEGSAPATVQAREQRAAGLRYLRLSDPDAPGRPRPRAPSV